MLENFKRENVIITVNSMSESDEDAEEGGGTQKKEMTGTKTGQMKQPE